MGRKAEQNIKIISVIVFFYFYILVENILYLRRKMEIRNHRDVYRSDFEFKEKSSAM